MRRKIFLIFLTLGIIISLNFFQREVKNFFYFFSSPLQRILFRTENSISDFFETLSEMKEQRKENEELKRKIQELMAENVKLKELERENKILREALKIKPKKEFGLFLSYFVSRDIASPDLILIKGGKKDGIEKGFPVITPEYALVGKIENVYKDFSQVKLISFRGFSFDAEIFGKENPIYGIVKGKGNKEVYLDKVLLDAEIKEKDIIVTAPLGGIFPEGLLVGEIKKVKKSELEPFQIAEVSPFFNLRELRTLFIITHW